MPASISSHAQSTLPDGRVLVTARANRTYIYTPGNNTWTVAASMLINVGQHGQSTLLDGRVLISGGDSAWPIGINSAYIYTPDSTEIGSWNEASPMSANFTQHGQSTLPNGNVLVSGGSNNIVAISTVYIYTPGSIWAPMATFPMSFRSHGQSTLLDGRVLISGGLIAGGWDSALDTTYVYTPVGTGAWTTATSMPAKFSTHKQSTLADGRVLVSGGCNTSGNVINTAYIYTHNAGVGSWDEANPIPTAFYAHAQSTLADGRVLVTGGSNASGGLNTTYIYTPTGWS